jgi:Tfp pilus assembly PilM family ATPase
MSQLLALEWNATEARIAAASVFGSRPIIEHAFSVSLRPSEAEGEPAGVDVGQRIAAALAARGIARVDAMLSIGRASIELRQLSLPPTPDDELPDMVRFQAMREFNELDENWLLDFLPIGESADGARNVLAAAIDSRLIEQLQTTCRKASLKPKRLILRPCAAASLFERARGDAETRPTLLVDLLSDEVDLTVMERGKAIFLRTTRLGGDPIEDADHAGALAGEIRRTTAAAQNQLGGERVEAVVLCGAGEKHAALARSLEERLGSPTTLFDPFEGLQLDPELRRNLPDHPGRFAPLLGILLAEAENRPHGIDFLHPRRRPKPPSRHRRFVAPAVAVLLVVGWIIVRGWMESAQLADEIDYLKAESKQWDQATAQAEKLQGKVAEIERWASTDVVWLDELRMLSEKFPSAKEAMLTDLTLGGSAAKGGGEMKMAGFVRSPAAIDAIEQNLRDARHHVEGKGSREDPSTKGYSWRFDTSLFVEKEDR